MDKTVKEYITELLRLLIISVPTDKARHNICINVHGVLSLNITTNGYWYEWEFDDKDLGQSPSALVNQILNELENEGAPIFSRPEIVD